jgi:thiosulfate/3-mercaptopyruvate sulfurtransferase
LHGVTRISLLDGGRGYWRALGLPYSARPASVDAVAVAEWQANPTPRIGYSELRARLAKSVTILDVRLDEEYRGELTAPAGYPALAQRAGHIAGAIWAPWEGTLDPDGRFLPLDQLRSRYARLGIDGSGDIVTYCGVGVRSAHTWFVLHELLGFERARNYDGGWAEWGSVIGAPIETGGGSTETA